MIAEGIILAYGSYIRKINGQKPNVQGVLVSTVDRRSKPRRNMQLGITLETPAGSQSLPASLRDISLSGAFIETNSALPTSAPLIMAFKPIDAPSRSGFRLYARVIRHTQTGIGVAFLPMPSDVINALSKALSLNE